MKYVALNEILFLNSKIEALTDFCAPQYGISSFTTINYMCMNWLASYTVQFRRGHVNAIWKKAIVPITCTPPINTH